MVRSALIPAAHGSRHDPAASAMVRAHAARLAARGGFDEVVGAFHQNTPHFSTVLDEVDANDFTVMPVMTSDGYFTTSFLPRELARNRKYGQVRVRRTKPVGTHPAITQLVKERMDSLISRLGLPSASTAVLIVGHGTPRNPQSRRATNHLARSLREAVSMPGVYTAFLDEEPKLETAIEGIPEPSVIVIPFLIGGSFHAGHDIRTRLGLKANGDPSAPIVGLRDSRKIICDVAVGTLPGIADIIAEIARRYAQPGRFPASAGVKP